MTREKLIDQAVLEAAQAWAVMLPLDRLLAYWEDQFRNGDLDGIAEVVVPVIQANFYAEGERAATTPRVSMPLIARRGGVPV